MEISKQIKKHRLDAELSQEELAEKIFVTRQTISNWENNRSYPDINSLILLSNFFDISLDILVKGDLEEMKEEIKLEDIQQFNRDSKIYTALLAALVLSAAPLLFYLHRLGIVLWAALERFHVFCLSSREAEKSSRYPNLSGDCRFHRRPAAGRNSKEP